VVSSVLVLKLQYQYCQRPQRVVLFSLVPQEALADTKETLVEAVKRPVQRNRSEIFSWHIRWNSQLVAIRTIQPVVLTVDKGLDVLRARAWATQGHGWRHVDAKTNGHRDVALRKKGDRALKDPENCETADDVRR
jgi:hypothetical protein